MKNVFYEIIGFFKDVWWLISDRKPYWGDAECCGRLFCRYCGGKLFNKD